MSFSPELVGKVHPGAAFGKQRRTIPHAVVNGKYYTDLNVTVKVKLNNVHIVYVTRPVSESRKRAD